VWRSVQQYSHFLVWQNRPLLSLASCLLSSHCHLKEFLRFINSESSQHILYRPFFVLACGWEKVIFQGALSSFHAIYSSCLVPSILIILLLPDCFLCYIIHHCMSFCSPSFRQLKPEFQQKIGECYIGRDVEKSHNAGNSTLCVSAQGGSLLVLL
jgi:hypothetical protein